MTRWMAIVSIGGAVVGCGGRSVTDFDRGAIASGAGAGGGATATGGSHGAGSGTTEAGGNGGARSEPGVSPGVGGTGADPGAPTTPEPSPCSTEAWRLERVWFQPYEHYGLYGYGYLGFSPEGERIGVIGPEFLESDIAEYRSADGELLDLVPGALMDRDAAWALELRGGVTPNPALVRLETGEVVASVLGRYGALSRDGGYVGAVDCSSRYYYGIQDLGADIIRRLSVPEASADAAVIEEAPLDLDDEVCFASRVPVVSTAGGHVLVANERGEILDVSFAPPSIRRASAGVTVVDMRLSPSESRLLVAGLDERVTVFSYPQLEPVLTGLAAGVTSAFDNCYCVREEHSPLAWSPDETLIATTGPSGTVALRSACDGTVLATAEAPVAATFGETGPSLIAFDPSGTHLAVYYEGSLVLYRIVVAR